MTDIIHLISLERPEEVDEGEWSLQDDMEVAMEAIASLDHAEWSTLPHRKTDQMPPVNIARRADGTVVHFYSKVRGDNIVLREIHVACATRNVSLQFPFNCQPRFHPNQPAASARTIASGLRLAPDEAGDTLDGVGTTNRGDALAKLVADHLTLESDYGGALDDISRQGAILTRSVYQPSESPQKRLQLMTSSSKTMTIPCGPYLGSIPVISFYKRASITSSSMTCIDIVDFVTLPHPDEDPVARMAATASLNSLKTILLGEDQF